MEHLVTAQLERGLDFVLRSPREVGSVEMIVCRPAEDERRVLEEAGISLEEGLVGDDWQNRHGAGGAPNAEAQVTVMNSRYIDLIAGDRKRWPLAGDQLYVDFDLSIDHLPAGTRLSAGSAVIEVSAQPHSGCDKFRRRFGPGALRLANSEQGRLLRLRGLNARVVVPGKVRRGDPIGRL